MVEFGPILCDHSGMRPTALIVDDHAAFRASAKTLLQDEGFQVVGEAGDGRSGLELARALDPDLVLLDVALPDADGFQILERIRSNQKILKIPVIMMTGKSEVTDVARGLSLGADGYVTKPFKISGLVAAVNTVLGIDQASS